MAWSSNSIGDRSQVMSVAPAEIRFDQPGLAPFDPSAPGVEIHWIAERRWSADIVSLVYRVG